MLRKLNIPLGWVWWVIVQLIMGAAMVVGWVVLIPFCLAQAWTDPRQLWSAERDRASVADGRYIDRWRWWPLNYVYGNPEDGVSGQDALVWINGVLGPYMPNAWAPWRAYCWSAWRNSCDSLKYVFAWRNGPRADIRGHKIGWWPENGFNVPVL